MGKNNATNAPDVTHDNRLGYRILPLGDRGLVVEIDAGVSRRATLQVRAMADHLRRAALPAVLDLVPAFCSLTIHYDPVRARDGEAPRSPFEAMRETVQSSLAGLPAPGEEATRVVEIPVCYGGAYGEDLEAVAQAHGMSTEEIIALHTAPTYFVGMLGFAPGFAYLAGLDHRLVTPRRATPRPRVPAGSVGIGGEHTGVYPFESPGGWNLIGRTPLPLFNIAARPPSLLDAGDEVRFVAVSEEGYKELAREQAWR